MSVELLHTARLQLRRWREDDLTAFFDIYSRWEVMRWLGSQPRTVLADRPQARSRLTRWTERNAQLQPPLGLWAIVPSEGATTAARAARVPSDPVGTVLLLPLEESDGARSDGGPFGDAPDGVEIGWHLRPDQQGAGLATEAGSALLAAAAAAGHRRVVALTDPDNVASQAVARRLGMVDEGTTERWYGLPLRIFAAP